MNSVIKFIRAQVGWLVAVLLLAAAAGGWWWWQEQQAAQARLAEQANVRTEVLARGNLAALVSATGSLQPNRTANLAFLVPGTVAEVLVVAGDVVTAGQPLARLDDANLQLSIRQAEDALAIAKINLDKVKQGASAEDIAVARANLRSANANAADVERGAGPQEAQIAQISYDRALEQYRQINEQYYALQQQAKDFPQFAPSQSVLDDFKKNVENAFYRAEVARLQVEQAKRVDPGARSVAYARIAQAQAQLEQVQAPPTELQIRRAELQVQQAELALEQARVRASRTTLTAPFSGVIAVVNLRVGETAGPGVPAMVLLDNSRFRLDITVSEIDVARLSEGQTVRVVVDALPEADITGRLDRIAPVGVVIGGGANYTVRVVLNPTEAPLRSGMSATAEVTVAEVQNAVLAPNWALSRDRQTGQVFLSVRRGETIERVPVTIGLRGDTYTEILSGASAGDEAAVSLSNPLLGQ